MAVEGSAVADLTRVADRLGELADVAELMGDEVGASRLRQEAAHRRTEAMRLLDVEEARCRHT